MKTFVSPLIPSACRSAGQDSCTTILIGGKATCDGSRIIARTEDHDPLLSKVLLKHPARENDQRLFQANENRFTYPQSKMAQAYSVFANGKPGKTDDQMTWGAAGFNQSGVGITATETIFASELALKHDPYLEEEGITEDSIVDIILPYVTSAREGAARLGKIIEERGAGEGFGVAFMDPHEIWYLETGTAHQWLATRLPDDGYFVTGNQGRLRDYDPNDNENYMASSSLIAFARQHGLYDDAQDGAFNFEQAYTRHDDHHDHYYNYPRVFALQQLYSLNPQRNLQQPQHFAVVEQPQTPLDIAAVKQGLRNTYENLGRQPYGASPDYTWRPISLFRTQQSHILQSRPTWPRALADVEYISYGMPSISVYIPFYPNGDSTIPPAYRCVTDGNADNVSAQWQFRKLQTLVMVDYCRYAPSVQAAYQQLEADFCALQQRMEQEYMACYQQDPKKADAILRQFSDQVFAQALDTTRILINHLFTQMAQDLNAKYLFAGA